MIQHLFSLCTAVLLLSSAHAGAGTPIPVPIASFGGTVAIAGDQLLVAEPAGFKSPGTVHVYSRVDNAWQMTAHLTAPDAAVGDGFGGVLAVHGNTLVTAGSGGTYFFARTVGSWELVRHFETTAQSVAISKDMAFAGAPGDTVFVYRRVDGEWTRHSSLSGAEDGFGRAVAMDMDRAMVTSSAAVTFYRWANDVLVEDGKFLASDLTVERGFGTAAHLRGNGAVVGSAWADNLSGVAHVFAHEGSWTLVRDLRSPDEAVRTVFGQAVLLTDTEVWVGAPGANAFAGAVHSFSRTGDQTVTLAPADGSGRSQFGGSIAADAAVLLVGMPGAAYGEGSARIFAATEAGWEAVSEIYNESEPLAPIAGEEVTCDDGDAAGYACGQVDLVSFLPLADLGTARGVRLSDVWGWTDPETGGEYALVGHLEGTAFVDVSDPSRPVFLGELPRTEGSPGSTWRDIKVYKDHAFIVADGAGRHGMQVFDLSRLRNVAGAPATFDADVWYGEIHSAHNIVINEDVGFAYAVGASGGGETCGGGLHMIDIREPKSPRFHGCYSHTGTGRRGTGYSHDAQCVVYHGPDALYAGREICIGANETAISIADITDKEEPKTIASGNYPDAMYVHQGWLSDDHAFFYQNDELDEISGRVDRTRTLVWDVSDLDDPVLVNQYFGPTSATDHNLYVRDNLMYQTNNASGLRILDITDRAEPREVGFFDTTPYGTDAAGFNGTWSSYPYFESGIIVVSSRREGLYILRQQTPGS